MNTTPKYPHIVVKLTERDGNAFSILGACQRAMRRAGVSQTELDRFFSEATAGDYNDLLATCMKWVDVA